MRLVSPRLPRPPLAFAPSPLPFAPCVCQLSCRSVASSIYCSPPLAFSYLHTFSFGAIIFLCQEPKQHDSRSRQASGERVSAEISFWPPFPVGFGRSLGCPSAAALVRPSIHPSSSCPTVGARSNQIQVGTTHTCAHAHSDARTRQRFKRLTSGLIGSSVCDDPKACSLSSSHRSV